MPAQRKAELLEKRTRRALTRWSLTWRACSSAARRPAIASQIREAFHELMDEANGVTHATVTSAVPLSEDELKAVTDKLSRDDRRFCCRQDSGRGGHTRRARRPDRRPADRRQHAEPLAGAQAPPRGSRAMTLDKAGVERELRESWERIRTLVDSLSAVEMVEPGVVEDWSVKDLLGHMAFWAGKAAADLKLLGEGRPEAVETPGGDEQVNKWNAREAAARKGKSLPELRAEWLSRATRTRRRRCMRRDAGPAGDRGQGLEPAQPLPRRHNPSLPRTRGAHPCLAKTTGDDRSLE